MRISRIVFLFAAAEAARKRGKPAYAAELLKMASADDTDQSGSQVLTGEEPYVVDVEPPPVRERMRRIDVNFGE